MRWINRTRQECPKLPMEAVTQIFRKSISMEKYSEKFISRILILLESSGEWYIYISSWWKYDADRLDSSLKCEIVRKVLKVNFIKPCSSETRCWIRKKRDTIESILFITCHFTELIETRCNIYSSWESLCPELLDHVRSDNRICKKIHHEWIFCLWGENYLILTFRDWNSLEKCKHLWINSTVSKSFNGCQYITRLDGCLIWPFDIISEGTFDSLYFWYITVSEISWECSCLRIIGYQATEKKPKYEVIWGFSSIRKGIHDIRHLSNHCYTDTSSRESDILSIQKDVHSDKV